MAARILDIAGLVMNRNTIPGDKTAFQASGVRMGTPWMTQRGLKEAEMVQVADIIADVLQATQPYTVETPPGPGPARQGGFYWCWKRPNCACARWRKKPASTARRPATATRIFIIWMTPSPRTRRSTVWLPLR